MNRLDNVSKAILNQTLKDIQVYSPMVIRALKRYGVSEIENEQMIETLGSVLKLSTFLRHKSLNPLDFLLYYEEYLNELENTVVTDLDNPLLSRPTLLALMPCGLKAGIDEALEKFSGQSALLGSPFVYRAEANVNHELSFSSYIESVRSESELPDVLLTADYNSFLHRRFIETFVTAGVFKSVQSGVNSSLEEIGYTDHRNNFTMFSANILVLVKVKGLNRNLPDIQSWGDLLRSEFYKSLVIRGQDSFFCSAVLLPFYKMTGMEGIVNLAESVVDGVHPSQMVKQIDSGQDDIAPLYIMPLFFARKIKRLDRINIIIPDEGALLSPVTLLVKRNPQWDTTRITEFLLGEQLQQLCADNYFLPVHKNAVNYEIASSKLYWLGWDYIYDNDLCEIKNKIGTVFTERYMAGRMKPCG